MTLTEQVRRLIQQQEDTPVCIETALTLLAEAIDAHDQELAEHLAEDRARVVQR